MQSEVRREGGKGEDVAEHVIVGTHQVVGQNSLRPKELRGSESFKSNLKVIYFQDNILIGFGNFKDYIQLCHRGNNYCGNKIAISYSLEKGNGGSSIRPKKCNSCLAKLKNPCLKESNQSSANS